MSTIIRSVGYDPSVGGYIPFVKRSTATLSDGSVVAMVIDANRSGLPVGSGGDATNVTKTYIYWSADRINWTLKATYTTSQVAAAGIVASMTVDSSNNIHVAYRTSTGSIVYNKLTYAAGPIWTVGANETVMAAPASTGYIQRLDIDCVIPTAGVIVAAWGYDSAGPQNYIRCFVRATTGGAWVSQTQQAILGSAPYSYVPDISVATNSGGPDGSNNIYYAVSVNGRKNAAGTDYGDAIVMFKSNNVTGAFVSAAVIAGSIATTGYNAGVGGGNRKSWVYSSAPDEYTLVGLAAGSFLQVVTYRWTYASGALVSKSPLTTSNTSNAITRPYAWLYCTTTYANDKAWVLSPRNADIFGQLVTFTRGSTTDSVALSSYTGPGDTVTVGHSTVSSVLLWGGNNRNKSLNKHDYLFYVFSASTGIYQIRHTYNLLPNAPVSVEPGSGSTVSTDRPILKAGFRLQQAIPQVRVKERWQISTDPGFAAQLKDLTQDDTAFVAPQSTNQGTTTILTSQTLDALSELYQNTWYIRSATVTEFGDQGPWSAATSFLVSHPPSAANTYPVNDKVYTYGASGVATFSWNFTDASPFDVQTAFQIVIERNDTGAAILDTGKIALAGDQNSASSATLTIPIGGKDLQLRWKIRLWDSDNVAGAFSTYQTFYIADGPTVSITSPAPASTITTGKPVVTWNFVSGGAISQASYRVIITAAGVIVYDSGAVLSSQTSHTVPVGFLKNSTQYTVSVYVQDNLGLQGSSANSFQTSWTPPAAPVFTVSSSLYKASGFIRLAWTNSTVDADFIAYRVYQRVTGTTDWIFVTEINTLQASYTYDFWLAGSGQSYDYTVTQVVDRFSDIVESVPVGASATGTSEYYWLIHLTDSSKNFLLYNVTAETFTDEYESETYHVIGRGRHVDYGERLGYSGSLSAQLRDRTGLTARQQRKLIEALKSERQEMFIRNPFGDVLRVAASDISVERVAGVATAEYVNVTIPYTEVGF